MNQTKASKMGEVLSREYFDTFCKSILGQKLGRIHEEWIDAVMNGSKHINIKAARGHFKTTILSVAFPLWIMFKYNGRERKTILICSGSLEQSTEIMGLIKEKISENPILREDLMPDNVHETKWSETQIRVKKGHRVICIPFGDGARGKHSNYTICDDILKDETTNIEYAKKTYYSVVFPTTQAKRGKHVVVGTPMSFTDLLTDLEDKETFKSMSYPSVILDEKGDWKAPQFPEHFSLDQLRDIQNTMPAHLWAREYMCRPVSDSSALFPYESHIAPCIELWNEMKKDFNENTQFTSSKFLGIDIAVSSDKNADFTVITEVKKKDKAPLFVSHIVRHKGFSINEIESLHQQGGYTRILIEKTGLGQGYVEALQKSGITRSAVVDFDTTRKSKELILSRLEVLMRNRQIAIPNNETLIGELMQMGIRVKDGRETYESLGRHKDTVMSLAIAVHAAEEYSNFASVVFV